MTKHPESLLVANALLDRAEHACQRRLMRDRDNPAVHCALAQIYRKQGRLIDAAAAYTRAKRLAPWDREACYMSAVLAGTPAQVPPAGVRPVPFVMLRDFLPRRVHGLLNARGIWNAEARAQACVCAMMPAILARLNAPVYGLVEGSVAYLYFFNPKPGESGHGDLLLFDFDLERRRYTTSRFTRILPEPNCLVLFPAACQYRVVEAEGEGAHIVNPLTIEGRVSRRLTEPLALLAR